MKTRRARPGSPDLFTPTCRECGRSLIPTESGYLCCPKGHGRLIWQPGPDESTAGLFEEAAARSRGEAADAFRRLAAAERGR